MDILAWTFWFEVGRRNVAPVLWNANLFRRTKLFFFFEKIIKHVLFHVLGDVKFDFNYGRVPCRVRTADNDFVDSRFEQILIDKYVLNRLNLRSDPLCAVGTRKKDGLGDRARVHGSRRRLWLATPTAAVYRTGKIAKTQTFIDT